MDIYFFVDGIEIDAVKDEMEDTKGLESYCVAIRSNVALLPDNLPVCHHPSSFWSRPDFSHLRICTHIASVRYCDHNSQRKQGSGSRVGGWC